MANKVKVSQYDGTMVKVGDRLERIDRGGVVPDHADAEHVAMLEERGMVADGEAVSGLAASIGPAPFDLEAAPADEDHAPRGRRAKSE